MVRWVSFAIGVVVLTVAATVIPQLLPDREAAAKIPVNTRTGPQPKVELDQPLIYDFGKMAQFEKGTHSWQIKNVGQVDLELWMIGKPTCSCTIAKLENNQKATVKPGESTSIDLEWNTKNLHEDYSQGARFGTNDPSMDSFMLSVKGKNYPPVVVFPPEMIQFSTISNEEPHFTRIAIYSKDRPATKVTKVISSKPGLIVGEGKPMTAEEAKQLKVEAGYNVNVTVKPGMPLGQFHEEMVIETDHPKRSEVKVSVGGLVIGPISVVPQGLRAHDISGRAGASRVLTLMVRAGKPAHFEVVSAPEKLKIDIVPDDSPGMKGRYRMTVTVPPGTPSGKIEGEIVLKTDHPQVKELKIPVDLFVLRSGSS